MAAQRPFVVFFKDIDKHDVASVGGKGANLGEMVQAGFPVPGGFAVTVASYDVFLEENGFDAPLEEEDANPDANGNGPECCDVILDASNCSFRHVTGFSTQREYGCCGRSDRE
ncbi:MAG: Pyruvate phosphate dikinase, PEP/pyruvate binding domain protein [Candidatus Peribacteria bacterium GW2011_GWB1_54_5]|nr:MAG: Pyruvate phosphate dikinase, PEP/pyruvate binding domain protein [Candidatus Peribacteria bacterium GW2011_GWB1_54_5]